MPARPAARPCAEFDLPRPKTPPRDGAGRRPYGPLPSLHSRRNMTNGVEKPVDSDISSGTRAQAAEPHTVSEPAVLAPDEHHPLRILGLCVPRLGLFCPRGTVGAANLGFLSPVRDPPPASADALEACFASPFSPSASASGRRHMKHVVSPQLKSILNSLTMFSRCSILPICGPPP